MARRISLPSKLMETTFMYLGTMYCLRFSGPSPGEKDAFPATPSLFTKEEAFQYLKLREIDKEQATQIYELVGGRVIHLKYMAEKITTNGTFEDLCKEMLSDMRAKLKSAEILPGRCYHKGGAKIICELLNKGAISEDTYYRLVDADTGDKLLETNAFAFRYNSQGIVFQSTAKKRFCEENSALWESTASGLGLG